MLKRLADPVVVVDLGKLVRALLMFVSRQRAAVIAMLAVILGGLALVSVYHVRSSLVSTSTLKLSAVGQPVPPRSLGGADVTPRMVVFPAPQFENATKDAAAVSVPEIPVERPTWSEGRLGDVYFEVLKAGTVTVEKSWPTALGSMPTSFVVRGDFTRVPDGKIGERVLRSLGMGERATVITDRPYTRNDLFTLVRTALGSEAIAIFGRKIDGSRSMIFTQVKDARRLAESIALIAGAPGGSNEVYLPFTGAILRHSSGTVTIDEFLVREPSEMSR